MLLHEIDWWLGFLEPIDSFLTYWAPILEGVGVFSVAALIMVSFGAPVFATGAVLGAIALLADWTVSATINDLQDFRYTIAMESSGGKVPISIEYGSNVVNWGVTVNGNKQKEISHWNTHPILNAKGVLNLFPAFFITETIYQGWD
ncbi:MAG: hypothetical protein HZB18_05030 [Chloroflexi bacterium]|nr:hypothetical protein [Chloroflexota bacterium]